jgi:S1-C subfamily serine protease
VKLVPELASKFGSPTGLRVVGVSTDSPAALGGIHEGDIVVEIDHSRVVSTTGVQKLMVENAIDRPIEVTVWRNGALVDAVVVPRELEASR